jgi:predicted cupin superfamily sugar epimerase
MNNRNADYWINQLELIPHPEGGFYREIYRSSGIIEKSALATNFSGPGNFFTTIYFLLQAEQVSHLHRIKSDEIWTFHTGEAVDIHVIDSCGDYTVQKLGLNPDNSEMPQQIVPANSWFGANLSERKGYALVSCIVSPDFSFNDFELGNYDDLVHVFPEYKSIIHMLT